MKTNTTQSTKDNSALSKRVLLAIWCLGLTTIALLSTILVYTPSPAYAQTQPEAVSSSDLDLTIFPPVAYLMVKPGKTITHTIVLDYQGTVPVQILPELVDFTTDGLTGQPMLQKPSSLNYVTLQNPDIALNQPFAINPGTKTQLVLKISPPLHADTDEFPLSLILTAQPTTSVVLDGSSTQTAGAIASNVILSVQEDFENQGQLQIERITFTNSLNQTLSFLKSIRQQLSLPAFVDSFGQITFEIGAQNVGRNAVAATGEITLAHAWSGKQLQHWYIYPDVILANSTRILRGMFINPDELEPDQEREFNPLSYKPAFLFGPYQVTTRLGSANDVDTTADTSREQTEVVFAFPFSVVGLLVLGVGLYVGYRWWEQHQSLLLF